MSAVQTRLCRLLLLHFAALGVTLASHVESSAPSAETIVARMTQARSENRARLRPYSVTRNYKLFGKEGQKARSEVVARVSFAPPWS